MPLHAKQPHCTCLIQSWKLEWQLNDYVNFLESQVGSANYWPLCLQLTSQLFNSLCCFHNKSPLVKILARGLSFKMASGILSWLRWGVKKADPAMNLTPSVFRGPVSPLLIKSFCKIICNVKVWICKTFEIS